MNALFDTFASRLGKVMGLVEWCIHSFSGNALEELAGCEAALQTVLTMEDGKQLELDSRVTLKPDSS